MATPIPRAVLSERFQHHMKARGLKVAAFLTYNFDPGFFEQEVLPVFVDVALHQVPTVRLLQLADAIRDSVDAIAVYYDRNALQPGASSAKLDYRRIPVTRPHGYVFHPKSVLALVEDLEPGDDGRRATHLIVASMSANLTRSGWWENVESCHIEELAEGSACGFRDDLLDLIKLIKRQCGADEDHSALDEIERFARQSLTQRPYRSADGVLHPRLYSGRQGFLEFLEEALGHRADDLNLEVVSPYFGGADAKPLLRLIERFRPRETRVFLPRDHKGAAACSKELADAVRAAGAQWGDLPAEVLKSGGDVNAAPRFVHAKAYRFFSRSKRYEALFVGSVNLTEAAHDRGCNLESGFLVETAPARVPDWWLSGIDPPRVFGEPSSGEPEERSSLTALRVRFDWGAAKGFVMWEGGAESPPLVVTAQGTPVFEITLAQPGVWEPLPPDAGKQLQNVLPSTSFLSVTAPGEAPAVILVQEEGMAQKPSLLQTLSASDILRYWSLLTVEQRVAFLEQRGAEISEAARELGVDVRSPPLSEDRSIFNTFAGIYHAFGTLERALRKEISDGRHVGVEYRLLGKQHDSLANLLDRLEQASGDWGRVERYVVVLCARQLLSEIRRELPSELIAKYRERIHELESRIEAERAASRHFEFDAPSDRERFLDWFEQRFLARSRREEVT